MDRTRPTSLIDRIVAWSFDRPLTNTMQYVVATLVIVAVAVGRVLFVPVSLPWLLFIPATIGIALVTGRRPGVYAAALSTVAGIVSIGHSSETTWLPRAQWIAAGLFLLVMLGLVALAAALRDSMRRARQLNVELVVSERQAVEREGFLSGVLGSSTDCIKVLDLEGRLAFMSEGGQRVMEVSDFSEIVGCPWPDFWQEFGNDEAKAAIDAARLGEARSFIGKARTMGGNAKWWHVAVSPIVGADGKPARILSVSRDITDLRASEEERDRFVRLAENSTDFIGIADVDGCVSYVNDAAREMVGLIAADVSKLVIADFFPPEQVERLASEVLPAVERDGHWSGELSFRHFATGEHIPVLYSVFPITGPDGDLIGYGTVTRDYRDRKRTEDDLRFLNGELAHRLKNVLAVVQSIAQQTLRSAIDTKAAAEALGSRLVALGAATDALTAGSWRSADLRELAESALSPHGDIGQRIVIEGPAVAVKAEVTIAFALALHELATNAAKYGALSTQTGTVRLGWGFDGEDDDRSFFMTWREQGGPPVSAPERRGFGSTLIERSLRSYLRGSVKTDYRPEGLVFDVRTRLADAAGVFGN